MIFQCNKDTKSATPLQLTSYTDLGILEETIESMIEKNPCEFLDEEIILIGKQISGWEETNETCDLLGLDKEGKLVVIEVKRDGNQHRDKNVTMQAIKYASYFSRYTKKDILDRCAEYTKYINKNITDIENELLEFLEKDEFPSIDRKPRIILIGKEFSPEVTSSVLWLTTEFDLNIKCISIVPYKDENGHAYISRQTIIPLKETEDYMVHVKRKEESIITEQNIKEEQIFKNLISNINNKLSNKLQALLELKQETDNRTYYYYGNYKYHYEIEIPKPKCINVCFHFENSYDRDKKDSFINKFKEDLEKKSFKIYAKGCVFKINIPCRFIDLDEQHISEFADKAVEKLSDLYGIISNYVEEFWK